MKARHSHGRVLLISDDLEANGIWSYVLSVKDFDVVTAGITEALAKAFVQDPFDLVVVNPYLELDVALTLSRKLRAGMVNPILLLISTQDEAFLLDAYEAGIDECIIRPMSHRLFLAKVAAWLRRSWTVPTEALIPLQAEQMRLDSVHRQLLIGDDRSVKLTNLEFRVLHLLMSHRGQVLGTNAIVDRIWGSAGYGDGVLLKNVVYRLRRKIEEDPGHPRYLQTVAGVGYTFRPG